MQKVKWIIVVFIIWRLVLFIPPILGQALIQQRTGYTYSNPWANFDGIHYLNIAASGYLTEARFFPLYPIIIRTISPIFGYFFSGFLISNISFLLALILLYKLIRLDYSAKIAQWAIIFLLVFPASFFFTAVYSESLFLFLVVLTFYLTRKRKWFFASLTGMFLTLTRPIGIIIFPVLLLEFFSIYLLLIPLAILSYAWFNLQKWGDALYFIRAQAELANSRVTNTIIFPPQTVFRYIKILLTVSPKIFEWWVAALELSVFIFGLVFLYILWKKKLRFSYFLLAVLGFFIPSSSGTFSGLPRYLIVLFPLFLGMAMIKNKVFKIFYMGVSAIILFLLLAFFSAGYFVA
jgi:Gpi18-like mannosyltransferase